MESVVVLTNRLRALLIDQCGAKPSLATLHKTFTAYQNERKPRMKHIMEYSSLITSVQAWRNPLYKFLACWVLPLQRDRAIADDLGTTIREAPKLDFVSVKKSELGRLKWQDEERETAKPIGDMNTKRSSGGMLAQLMSTLVAIGMVVFAAQSLQPSLFVTATLDN